jgi:Haemolymph juvenile hormone binding protein (JHBP).
MDPLEIKEISVSDGPSQSGLNLTMRDVKMHGLKDADIKKVQ